MKKTVINIPFIIERSQKAPRRIRVKTEDEKTLLSFINIKIMSSRFSVILTQPETETHDFSKPVSTGVSTTLIDEKTRGRELNKRFFVHTESDIEKIVTGVAFCEGKLLIQTKIPGKPIYEQFAIRAPEWMNKKYLKPDSEPTVEVVETTEVATIEGETVVSE